MKFRAGGRASKFWKSLIICWAYKHQRRLVSLSSSPAQLRACSHRKGRLSGCPAVLLCSCPAARRTGSRGPGGCGRARARGRITCPGKTIFCSKGRQLLSSFNFCTYAQRSIFVWVSHFPALSSERPRLNCCMLIRLCGPDVLNLLEIIHFHQLQGRLPNARIILLRVTDIAAMCTVVPADLGNRANVNKSKLLHPFVLHLKCYLEGKRYCLHGNSMKVSHRKQKRAMELTAHFSVCRPHICFLPDWLLQTAAVSRVNSLPPRPGRAQLQKSPRPSLGEAGRRKQNKTKLPGTPPVGFTSSLQTPICPKPTKCSKPTKCLRSSRKPKPGSTPSLRRQTTSSPPHCPGPGPLTAPWLCLKYLRLLSNTLPNKTPARGH